eukprot:CAMPEP_0177677018 /NCGR_PEP_ID=MMETSP0447-20121125/28142_1 /TAXON_ID=0 /ORGANISM="Stygamoeba regulata, Strain BSH-02190019" /LENGTH=68 /DNA_ID=CAMNT_0019185707 /DNA_START=198 /DNA_END=401 /DNA_ORIENTATION=+
MQVLQPNEDTLGDRLHDGQGYSTVLVQPDQAEQVAPQHLKSHADVCAVWATDLEVVKQNDNCTVDGVP